MRKKIVVGHDGTDQATDALHLGAGLARALDAHLLVASAIEFASLDGSGPLDRTVYTESDHAGYNAAKAEYFDRIFGQARAELGQGEFERHPLQDTAAHGLTELAETVEAHLVVIGSTHHGPIRRVLAGTVAARLLHGAPCAVAVAYSAPGAAAALGSGCETRGAPGRSSWSPVAAPASRRAPQPTPPAPAKAGWLTAVRDKRDGRCPALRPR